MLVEFRELPNGLRVELVEVTDGVFSAYVTNPHSGTKHRRFTGTYEGARDHFDRLVAEEVDHG